MSEARNWEDIAEGLGQRKWVSVRNAWLDHIPNSAAGRPPAPELEEYPNIDQRMREIDAAESKAVLDEFAGFRQAAFADGVFLIHKAVFVLERLDRTLRSGTASSWAISDGYHSAAFGVRGILRLMGAVMVRTGNTEYLFDLWPKHAPRRRAVKRSAMLSSDELHGYAGPLATHADVWTVFRRLLTTTRTAPWPSELIQTLRDLKPADYARHRNRLHYQTGSWPIGEVYPPPVPSAPPLSGFGRRAQDLPAQLDPEDPVFCIALGRAVVYLGAALIESVAESSPRVRRDFELIRCRLELCDLR